MVEFKHDGVSAGCLAPGMRQGRLLLQAAMKQNNENTFFHCFVADCHHRLLSDDIYSFS